MMDGVPCGMEHCKRGHTAEVLRKPRCRWRWGRYRSLEGAEVRRCRDMW